MTCEDFKADVGAYALGSLDPGEKVAMEEHLAQVGQHDGCVEALSRARLTISSLDALPAPAPPAAVWERISERIRPAERRVARVRVAAGAGWLLAVASLTLLLIVRRQYDAARDELTTALGSSRGDMSALAAERDHCQEDLARLRRSETAERDVVALLSDPGARVVAMKPSSGKTGHATAILNGSSTRALVVSAQLRAVPGKSLQLWVIRGETPPVPAGFLHQQDREWMQGEIPTDVLRAGPPDAVAISLEPEGGRPNPSDILLTGKL